MKLHKGEYIKVLAHGEGMHYLCGPTSFSLIESCEAAKRKAVLMNANKSPRAPKVSVLVLRIVEVYDGSVT